ncbi:hypothetical protein, partial [Nostoc sp. ChiSLP03a]|uniref:hypothetical protein n=1 Tax=Nostoc sp. ChiSLP03a TaxID=3075380 RepID=UPI002AD4A41D
YSTLQLNEVQNQGFANQIILLPLASCLLPPASKPVNLYLMQKKTAVRDTFVNTDTQNCRLYNRPLA